MQKPQYESLHLGTHAIASSPGRSRLQFLITCRMQKRRGWGGGERVKCMKSGRHRNILSKNLRL